MMNDHLNRIYQFKGNPCEIGFTAGHMLGDKLEQTLSRYIANLEDSIDIEKNHTGALPWLRNLPKRFLDEFEGMAEGANIPLQHIAEWAYIEECEIKQCSTGEIWYTFGGYPAASKGNWQRLEWPWTD